MSTSRRSIGMNSCRSTGAPSNCTCHSRDRHSTAALAACAPTASLRAPGSALQCWRANGLSRWGRCGMNTRRREPVIVSEGIIGYANS
ncbi:hypothetical protein G6F63_016920 [Rhizopus arrhizus]|nr:hypothetical protein G6F63_016920 [Rhizopus arrhizus]